MLRLKSKTAPEWVDRALADVDTLLLDHAHCEKKAASTALGLIFRYPDHAALLRPLSALAREELEHFELVLDHLEARGRKYGRLRPSPYAGQLMTAVRTHEPARLLDLLLICALIEARSCERMMLLAKAATDAKIAALYGGLLESEARHHALYVDLALGLFDRETVRERLDALAEHEASVIDAAPPWPRMHT
ncbi:MAG: tRNA-(ms[2]io[6]A)-hydroxylase [Myxococcales bacterium]|nr:tRNA-(ms[2]io[6]A)-hydroxylase [Myxococcales bacterium]